MKRHIRAAALLSIALVGPVAAMKPDKAVLKAAAAAPRGISGRFDLRVRATGRANGQLYLNSEDDYRDQRNLTIVVPPDVEGHLAGRLSGDPAERLKGHRIRVAGVAQRVRIVFTVGGRPSGKYYYQTHVRLADDGQLKLLD